MHRLQFLTKYNPYMQYDCAKQIQGQLKAQTEEQKFQITDK